MTDINEARRQIDWWTDELNKINDKIRDAESKLDGFKRDVTYWTDEVSKLKTEAGNAKQKLDSYLREAENSQK